MGDDDPIQPSVAEAAGSELIELVERLPAAARVSGSSPPTVQLGLGLGEECVPEPQVRQPAWDHSD